MSEVGMHGTRNVEGVEAMKREQNVYTLFR